MKAPHSATQSSRPYWEAQFTDPDTGVCKLPVDIDRMLIAQEDDLKQMFPDPNADYIFDFQFQLPFPVKATRNPDWLTVFKVDGDSKGEYGSIHVEFSLETSVPDLYEKKKKKAKTTRITKTA